MELPSDRLKTLLLQYADDTATESEQQELFSLITNTNDTDLQSSLIACLQTIQPDFDEARRARILNTLLAHINENGKAKVISIRRPWIKWVAAACIIALVGVLANVWLKNSRQTTTTVAQTHDVPAPKGTRAVIILANGTKVYLDSTNNGTIAQENNVNVVKNANGEVVYAPSVTLSGVEASTVRYNTLFNPRGSKVISLTLSDGTKVWLNSESSLRYPASFAPSALDREVEITGEAYFEVKHNAKQPFNVHLPNGSIVEDIGTAFNINAYTDEDAIKTTLIEGKVRLSPAGANAGKVSPTGGDLEGAVALKPGQQAIQIPNSKFQITNAVDVDEVMAWKNGQFSFSRTNIVTIMKQIERWYDVEVSFSDDVKGNDFTGGIARTENVSEVLKMLEKTGAIHFKIEGRKIIVTK